MSPPVTPASCEPVPAGLKLYGGLPVSEVERLGRFPMQHPERRYLETSNQLWLRFRDGLKPTDLVFEYVHDESWEGGAFHHGGVSAFRGGCSVKIEQVWIT